MVRRIVKRGSAGIRRLRVHSTNDFDTFIAIAPDSDATRGAAPKESASFSRYHAEAGIAAEHCLAPSFAQTRWDRIVESYALLERLSPSALHTLNRALAIAELNGPAEALADLHRRAGHRELAQRHRDTALAAAPSTAVRDVLARRLRASDGR